MPTTDPSLGIEFLENLQSSGIDFALVHSTQQLTDIESDIDIVASTGARQAILQIAPALTKSRPVLLWPYEPGGAANVFLASEDLIEGAQIDILWDVEGRGRLGFRTEALLAETIHTGPYPRLAHLAELAYLIRKRTVKRDLSALDGLAAQARAEVPAFVATLERIATPRAVQSVMAVLDGFRPHRVEWAQPSFRHTASRLRRPVGAWIHLIGRDCSQATELSRRLSRYLPHVEHQSVPARYEGRIRWWISKIQRIRVRPGAYVSWGQELNSLPLPDVQIQCSDVAYKMVNRQLSDRVLLGASQDS